MSRYRGSIFKKARRYGFSVLENGKEFSKGKKRTSAPGQHGEKRVKLSEYGQQMQEKQKVKFIYGLTERQFRNTYSRAKKIPGITGTNFLQQLESRLDNIVYRMGIAATRQGARQFVNHGHILVDGKRVDIPSYSVKPGQKIKIRDKMKKNPKVIESLNLALTTLPFVSFDKTKFEGEYVRLPERDELNRDINEALVVEWYNLLIK
ncbi:30S ribosomal protein S4 [Spiroplasma endosymbiont of Aspidapion aeneum]|uniref:30S ribosomal protein S4 n=1 Tax=Spiroplasma endosymbiont of Aspidapion aeneum TaxID=3066276 RepID=UPI00313E50E4